MRITMRKIWIGIALLLCSLCEIVFAAEVPLKLRVYGENDPERLIQGTSDYQQITSVLNSIGVLFEQWPVSELLTDYKTEDILVAYKEEIERLVQENGYKSVDVVRMLPNAVRKDVLREKFLNEHTHSEDEVRFFVEGSGLFYLHVGENVYIVLCEAGDLISIPAHYTHWFDMGSDPYFTAIRFFIEPEGWVARFTESGISQKFPRYGD
jgi:1,2-dihydroxy-3-keto-5-methylthiopentene dioxygenase